MLYILCDWLRPYKRVLISNLNIQNGFRHLYYINNSNCEPDSRCEGHRGVQGREERRASRQRNCGRRKRRQSRPAGRRGIGPGLFYLDQTMR